MVPAIVIDTETTGFPSRHGGFRARIVEFGAVVVTGDRRVVSPISFFVRQPARHLKSWQAQRAMSVHGISVSTVLSRGIAEQDAAPRLERWVQRVRDRYGVAEVRAYNQAFDFWFLEQTPWDLFDRTGLVPGEDILETAKRGMERSSGPKLQAAVDFANRAGGGIPWLGDAHRAGEDARMAALVALHFTD